MPSRRCAIGCESWPAKNIFISCPTCGERTVLVRDDDPTISDEDARSVVLHAVFDAWYEKRCARLGIPAHGPLPADKLVA